MTPVTDRAFEETPFCVLDLETTGLSPGLDRIVELTAIRIDPGDDPRLALDTLVYPERHVSGTEIHGITDADVDGAPNFDQLLPELREAMSDAVLVSYNVYFDHRFLAYEFERLGQELEVPHLCAMYMRPLLGIGKRCPLRAACEEAGLEHVGVHSSAGDAIATVELMQHYFDVVRKRDARTFGDLAKGKRYKFLKSWSAPPPSFPSAGEEVPKKSRALEEQEPSEEAQRRWRLREYQDAVLAFLDDYTISPEEAEYAKRLQGSLGISHDEIRAVHARIFAATLNQWAADDRIDDAEARHLGMLSGGLAALGWSPG